MLRLINVPYRWEGQGLLDAWQKWWNESSNERERTIPLLITWGTWLARNQVIFKDSVFPIGRLAAEGASIYESIPIPQALSTSRAVCQESVRYSIPWAYFDGASDINGRCGAGLIIHFSKEKVVKASIGLGQGSNNFSFKALHLLLCWLILRNVREAQIFGDSMNVVKWFSGAQHCRNLTLIPLFKEVSRLRSRFMEISLSHIYQERNFDAGRLSKAGVEFEMGVWSVSEVENGVVRSIEQPIFV